MRISKFAAALLSCVAALLALCGLAGCPKGGMPEPKGAAENASGEAQGSASAARTGAQSGATKEPSVSDYLDGRAGTEIVNTADGQSMPQGWPLTDVLPPAGSSIQPGAISRQPWVSGAVQWLQPFSCPDGWTAVQSAVEDSLRRKGFQLVRGEKTPVEPELGPDGHPAVGFTRGERSYRSQDGRTLVFLRAELRKVPERPQDVAESFQLQIVYFDAALPVPGTSKLEDL